MGQSKHCRPIQSPNRYRIILLLLMSGDVKRNQQGIQCESCLLWHHAKCIDMPVSEYNYLSNSSDDWLALLFVYTTSFYGLSVPILMKEMNL